MARAAAAQPLSRAAPRSPVGSSSPTPEPTKEHLGDIYVREYSKTDTKLQRVLTAYSKAWSELRDVAKSYETMDGNIDLVDSNERSRFASAVDEARRKTASLSKQVRWLMRDKQGAQWATNAWKSVQGFMIKESQAETELGPIDKPSPIPQPTDPRFGSYVETLVELYDASAAGYLMAVAYGTSWDAAPVDADPLKLGDLDKPKQIRQELLRRVAPVLEEVDALEGLQELKDNLRSFVDTLSMNRFKELKGLQPTPPRINAVFTGRPGTGKSTVARLYARFLEELGFVEPNRFQEVTAKDLLGDVVGGSRQKTADILEKAKGGVLFIDEAYLLDPSRAGNSFAGEAIGELVAFMENNPDTSIVFAGYEKDMEKFFDSNEGLASRVQMKFPFADFADDELANIFRSMCKADGLVPTDEAAQYVGKSIGRLRSSKEFANARSVRNLKRKAVEAQNQRLHGLLREDSSISEGDLKAVTLDDVMSSSDAPIESAEVALKKLDEMVGLQEAKTKIRDLVDFAEMQKMQEELGLKRKPIRLHTAFSGGPGTGKTTVARHYAQALCGAGLLPTNKVTEISGSDLIGQFVGDTEKQVEDILQSANGGVLFIDEAFGMIAGANARSYGESAVKRLIKFMEEHYDSIAVIFADYPENIEAVLDVDAGMRRRLGDVIGFADFKKEELGEVLQSAVEREGRKITKATLTEVSSYLEQLAQLPGFGNAGEVMKLIDNAQTRVARRVMAEKRKGKKLSAKDLLHFKKEDFVTKEMWSQLTRRIDLARAQGNLLPREEAPVKEATAQRVKPKHQHNDGHAEAHRLGAEVAKQAKELGMTAADAFNVALRGDGNDPLVEAVAEALGQTAQEVADELKAEAEQALEKASTDEAELGFICMYCGSKNPGCPFKGQPDANLLAQDNWSKIDASLVSRSGLDQKTKDKLAKFG